jgi:hypothetical protein
MSKNRPHASDEASQEGAAIQPRPRLQASPTTSSEEIFQEGTTPVQAFYTPVVPADHGTETRLRQGRPPRASRVQPPEAIGLTDTAEAGTDAETRTD